MVITERDGSGGVMLRIAVFALMIFRARRAFADFPTTVLLRYVSALLQPRTPGLLAALSVLLGDAAGVAVVAWFWRWLRGLKHLRWKAVKKVVMNAGYTLAQRAPGVKGMVEAELAKTRQDLSRDLKPEAMYRDNNLLSTLPAKGRSHAAILGELEGLIKADDAKWQTGKVSGCVYHGGKEHIELTKQAYGLYSQANPLHVDVWPSIMRLEAEVVAMVASMMNGGDNGVCGTVTSGGTESIMLACKTHRDWGRSIGITHPEMVVPFSAHAAFMKSAETMGIRIIRVPTDPCTHQVDLDAVRQAITADTVMLVGSAPNYAQGIIDDFEGLSEIAVKHQIGLHVDCCLGGFVLPFGRKLERYSEILPAFDFGLRGVTSMSVDTHKFGFAAKGTSVVLYRNEDLRRFQFFCYEDCPIGLYATPSFAGSRPGGLSAACWAAMVSHGEDGYMECTERALDAAVRIKQFITDRIDGIHVMGDPVAMIVAFGSEELNVYTIADKMKERGWMLNSCLLPACVHVCCHKQIVSTVDLLLEDLSEVVAGLRMDPKAAADAAKQGSAPMYGTVAAVPPGAVRDTLRAYCDVVYDTSARPPNKEPE